MGDPLTFSFDDDDLRNLFIVEAREQLETLDQGFVRLEREPGDTELVQTIFRAAHTLKSSSAAIGMARMAADCVSLVPMVTSSPTPAAAQCASISICSSALK